MENLSNSNPEAFWRHLQANSEVYLKNAQGNAITPLELPATIKSMEDDPFRSLAGAVREACAFKNQAEGTQAANYVEFAWADYLRANWAKTDIPVSSINGEFDRAIAAALTLATEKAATDLPGYTGKAHCN